MVLTSRSLRKSGRATSVSITQFSRYPTTLLIPPVVFFGHLTPDVEDLRYQHLYHPVPIEQKCPKLAHVINEVSAGLFGDGSVYEPYVQSLAFQPSAMH